MFGRFKFKQIARASVVRVRKGLALLWASEDSGFAIGGVYTAHCYGPDGVLKWSDTLKNGVTDAGIAHLLNVYFRATSPVTAWYLGLIDNSGYTALAAADTSASHAGWSEAAGSNYSETNRVQWSPGAPATGAIVNSTSSDFSITAASALTVKGLFLISDNTKGGSTGTLFSTALFTGGNQVVNSGDTLKITYTVSAASS